MGNRPDFIAARDRSDDTGWVDGNEVQRWYQIFVRDYPPRRAFELAYQMELAIIGALASAPDRDREKVS